MKDVHIATSTKRLYGAKCPRCGKLSDGATAISFSDFTKPPVPKPGDYSVCAYCSALLVYTRGLALRLIERTERRQLVRDPKNAALVRILEQATAAVRRNMQ